MADDLSQSVSRQAEYDALFEKVIASINAGRYQPIPTSEHSLIWEVCAEAVDLKHKEPER